MAGGIGVHWYASPSLNEERFHPRPADVVAANPVDGILVTSHHDGALRRWTTSGEPLGDLSGHHGKVTEMAVSPDGRWLAVAGPEHVVVMRQAAHGHLVQRAAGGRRHSPT